MQHIKATLDKKKIVVTGGLGFVGHNLVKFLVDNHDADVTVIDNCINSKPAILGDHLDKVTFIEADVTNFASIEKYIAAANYVFHLACVQIGASSSIPRKDVEVNAISTLDILEFLRHKRPAHFERFIYTSSASIYGSTTHLPIKETSRTKVLSNYAATKLLGENYTTIYGANYDIPVTSVRYSNIYGYGQTPQNPYCGVLGIFIHNAILGKDLTVIGDGEQTRDYTFITDAVAATTLAAVHPAALNEVYNVGSGVETSVNKLAEIIKDIAGNIEIRHIAERDIDNIRRRVMDIELIHQKLRWTPKVNIRKGIELTIEHYRKFIAAK
jgi:UDP-glucose 4-epimerase